MKKIKNLNQELQKLQKQKDNFISIEDASLKDFIKYKHINSKIKQLKENIEKINRSAEATKLLYETNEKKWMKSQKINCRKYCKLQMRAEYKRDLKLYKLGFLDKRPPNILFLKIQPFLEKIQSSVQDINYSKLSCFRKFHNKYNYFKSYFLPQQVNKLAINTAKLGIRGYRKLQEDCKFIRNNITSNDTFKYIKNTFRQANAQVDYEQSHNRAFTPDELKFRESIRFNPDDKATTPPIKGTINIKRNIVEHTL